MRAERPLVRGFGRGIRRQRHHRPTRSKIAAELVDRHLPAVALIPDVLLEHRDDAAYLAGPKGPALHGSIRIVLVGRVLSDPANA